MIKVNNVVKKFGNFTALNGINCSIPEGCIYGLVGSNGAGKSTLLRLLTGVYKADCGSVTFDDLDIYTNTVLKETISYLPDELYFLPGASMNRMADFYRSIYKNFNKDRYTQLVNDFQLNPKASLNSFSKGMKRQASVILALACQPKYLFFDETFDGLDPIMRNLVKGLICQDVAERNATAIITSHSLRELEDTCDQLALLHQGGLVFEQDIQDLKTTLFKVQIAFTDEYTKDRFDIIDVLHFSKRGSVSNLIVRGDKEETLDTLKHFSPTLLEIVPLTLEEVFTFELEALGYNFDAVLEEISHE